LISHIFLTEVLDYFIGFCVYKQKQKELKRQKKEKEKCFANPKE
jgi:hypothetical protein